MAPSPPRLRILSVGGNAVSAFLSWRLQATNACDVTLVWKNGYQAVSQYGISFKSTLFGNERFKPRYVVQSTDDAATKEAAYDYVLLCVKALPDIYDLAAIIESVVTPQHTCIIVNTTNTLGVEQHLEERFQSNVVLSLVSGADLVQLGASEFEHAGNTDIWVGPASQNSAVPESIAKDMSEALAMTLSTGHVDCKVSSNIRQQQFERMIGPIAFQPVSVIFETASIPDLIEKSGVRDLVSGVIDELLQVASNHNCLLAPDFKEKTMQKMLALAPEANTMFQDFIARRPMEIETYLGTPIKFARDAGISVPRLQTLYAMLHHVNTINQSRRSPMSQAVGHPPPRVTSAPPPPRPMNGPMRGGRMPPGMGMQFGPSRRGPPPVNGNRGAPNGYHQPMPLSRKPSMDDNNLDEFSHVVLYDDIPEGGVAAMIEDIPNGGVGLPQNDLREQELRRRLRQQEMAMRRGGGGLRGRGYRMSRVRRHDIDEDDDDDEDYFDPTSRGPPLPQIDPDNFDMMSITSRRTRKSQVGKNVFNGEGGMLPAGAGRPHHPGRSRGNAPWVHDSMSLHDNLLDNPMMGYSSNRYGEVDRKQRKDESRASSLTASRMQNLAHGGPSSIPPGPNGGPYPIPPGPNGGPYPNPPGRRGTGLRSPHQGYPQQNGMSNGIGRPPPPGIMRSAASPHPPEGGELVHPQQVEQQAGVSKPFPPPNGPAKSLTGSASASAGSGDSGSANIDSSEPSAHSSQSSFAPRQALGTR